MRSANQSHFAKSPQVTIERSKINRSHGLKTAFNGGLLIPVLWDEALPGDTITARMSTFARLATPIFPIVDNLYLESFFFAVPYRLIWNNWVRFQGQQNDPGDSIDYLVPTVTSFSGGFTEESIYDYFGIPTKVDLTVNSLHMRAYSLIWDEWFRDENLQDRIGAAKNDGPDQWDDFSLKPRGKRHDYLTSCLPWPQKGDAISLPLGISAPVVSAGTGIPTFNTDGTGVNLESIGVGAPGVRLTANVTNSDDLHWNAPNLETDLTAATAATINQIRQAFQLQRLNERDARGGTRYTEMVRSHFGVTSDDARQQRPEYLGGGSQQVNFTPVANTTDTESGTLAAFATSSSSAHSFSKSFTEHCLIIGMVALRADLNYQQGLERMWSRQTRADYFLPVLAHIGEQAVLNKEIYAQGTAADDDVFGYQGRFDEYRFKNSSITGAMRSNAATPLDAWHLAQDFGNLPTLGADFIEDNPPIGRIVATPSEPDMLFDAFFDYQCVRPIPVTGTPGGIDRF